jgi:hypothetical protein
LYAKEHETLLTPTQIEKLEAKALPPNLQSWKKRGVHRSATDDEPRSRRRIHMNVGDADGEKDDQQDAKDEDAKMDAQPASLYGLDERFLKMHSDDDSAIEDGRRTYYRKRPQSRSPTVSDALHALDYVFANDLSSSKVQKSKYKRHKGPWNMRERHPCQNQVEMPTGCEHCATKTFWQIPNRRHDSGFVHSCTSCGKRFKPISDRPKGAVRVLASAPAPPDSASVSALSHSTLSDCLFFGSCVCKIPASESRDRPYSRPPRAGNAGGDATADNYVPQMSALNQAVTPPASSSVPSDALPLVHARIRVRGGFKSR